MIFPAVMAMQVAHQKVSVLAQAVCKQFKVHVAVEYALGAVVHDLAKLAEHLMSTHPILDGLSEIRVIRPSFARIIPEQDLHLLRQTLSFMDSILRHAIADGVYEAMLQYYVLCIGEPHMCVTRHKVCVDVCGLTKARKE